jgi:hypothetical protein
MYTLQDLTESYLKKKKKPKHPKSNFFLFQIN